MIDNQEKSSVAWHARSIEEVSQLLDTDPESGLSDEQVTDAHEKYGKNTLEAQEEVNPVILFFKQVKNPLIYLLAAAAVVSIIADHYIDAAVIGGVIVLNSILGFVQEWRAEKALEALRSLTAPSAKVFRNGKEREIDASDIVPGDILVLEAGDRVAADSRIVSMTDLEINESALTGESEPVSKKTGELDEETPLADRTNMVWMSSPVTSGRGRAIVIGTGMDTEMGKIAGEVRSTERERTPLQIRMSKLGIFIGIAAVVLASGIFALGLFRGYEVLEMLIFSVAAAVSAIPAGLPAVISVTLALGVQRMSKQHAIIRRLPAVETLGSTTVICSDKTGTITRNEMTVTNIWAGGKLYEITGLGYKPEGEVIGKESGEKFAGGEYPGELNSLFAIGVLANNASLDSSENQWKILGSPTEGAIVVASEKSGLDSERFRRENIRIDEIPFSSDRKYMAALYEGKDSKKVAYVKGAPEKILGFCTHIYENGEVTELTEERRNEIREMNITLAAQALRVVGGAYREFPDNTSSIDKEDVENNLVLAGLWGMIDPPRQEAIEATRKAREAGIRIVMLTGDHAVTAAAIAKEVGITDEFKEAVTGTQVEDMEKDEIAEKAFEVRVFARVTPEHKLKILDALKEKRQVVAMTGDGVNDAPALKGANIGIAMGITGTEVAKEAADMILEDDNFATIVNAVEEGRMIFSNLRRVVFYLLTTNLAEILHLTAALVIGFPLPLTAIMILWINLVTDGACTIPLGVEPKHYNVLKQPPRDPGEHVINRMVRRKILLLAPIIALGTLGLFWYQLGIGTYEHAQTVAFTTLAAFQWFQAFTARSLNESIFKIGFFTNRWLLLGVGIAIILQIFAIYTGPGQLIFGTVFVTLYDWALILPIAASILVVDEILKKMSAYGKQHPGRNHGTNQGNVGTGKV